MRPDWPLALRHAREVARGSASRTSRGRRRSSSAFLRAPDLVRALNVFYLAGHFVLTGRLLRLALPPLAARVPRLPERLPARDRDRARGALELPDGAAAPRGRRPRGHAPPASPASTSARPARPRSRTRSPRSRRSTPAGPSASASASSRLRAPASAGKSAGVALPARGRADRRRDRQPLRPRRRSRAWRVTAAALRLACLAARASGAKLDACDAGWSSQVARRAHNPEVAGSNPAPATTKALLSGAFCFLA